MIAKPILFIWGKAINQAAARASQRFNGFGDPLDRLLLVQPKMAEWGQQLKRRSVSGSRRSRAAACPEDARRAAFELCLPGRNLVGVHVELFRQLGKRPLTLDRRQRYLCLEGRRVVPPWSSAHCRS
jgi:hypothetical protein